MDVWNLVAERKIREAMEEGVFDHLDGVGQPLDLSENPYEDPSQRMAHRLLKNNGFAPAWILEGKEIERDLQRLRADRPRLTEFEYREAAEKLDRRIAAFNLKVPLPALQKPPC
jgi:DnaJ homolog subfamily C member 28